MSGARDVVVIGGGHNALVAAFYLARRGLKPLVLERRGLVGGAAITEEFAPGFRCSTLAHAVGPVRADIVRDLDLARHGLQMVDPDPRLFAPTRDGRAIVLHGDTMKTADGLRALSAKDAGRYPEFVQAIGHIAEALAPLLSMTPPDIDRPTASDLWGLLKTGKGIRDLGKKDLYRLLRWGPMAVADLVSEFFESDALRATIAARGIFGTYFGPWSAGSTAILLLRAAADPHPAGPASYPKGGMGALTQAMAAAAKAAGAEIRTGVEVARIVIRDGRAHGVILKTGEEIQARAVVSGADPRRTFLGLVDPVHVEPDFTRKIRNVRCRGTVAKVNLALDGLPTFTAVRSAGAAAASILGGRIHIGPEIDTLERAFDTVKYGEISPEPYLDAQIPTLGDPSLAPAGKHVLSVCFQFAPRKLKRGDWSTARDTLAETTVKTMAQYAPDLPKLVRAVQVITPADLEETWSLTGGHIYHAELALDQLFTMRPILGQARYRTPFHGLYLCGAGTHPGHGVNGASGANAAREILKDLKR